jgi:hypothetical protein
MIVCGLITLRCDWKGRPIEATSAHWTGLIGGAVVIILSFTWNYRALLAGVPPDHFNWFLFSAGLLAGMGTFAHAWLKRR